MKTFNELMQYSGAYKDKLKPERWQIIETLYTDNYDKIGTPKIPKIIHQIWLGSDLPRELVNYTESVKCANPDYTYKLWTDKDVESFEFKNKDKFLACRNYGQRSDILRYAILEQTGGIYLDTDFICKKSFDELLHLDFFAGVAYDRDPTIFNGLIGTTPNNALIKSINEINEIRDGDGMEIIKSTGPWYITEKIFELFNSIEKIVILPVAYFYPYPNFGHDKCFGNNYSDYITEETICTHLWHSRWN